MVQRSINGGTSSSFKLPRVSILGALHHAKMVIYNTGVHLYFANCIYKWWNDMTQAGRFLGNQKIWLEPGNPQQSEKVTFDFDTAGHNFKQTCLHLDKQMHCPDVETKNVESQIRKHIIYNVGRTWWRILLGHNRSSSRVSPSLAPMWNVSHNTPGNNRQTEGFAIASGLICFYLYQIYL